MIVVIIGVIILVGITLGYSFNQRKGHLEQGGILQVSSRPAGAKLMINGHPHPSNTPAKIVSEPGDYSLQIERDGYRPWQKTAPIQAGNITWVMYPRLIPRVLTQKKVLELPTTVADGLSSGSSKRYAFLTEPGSADMSIANLDSEDVKLRSVSVPSDIYTTSQDEKPVVGTFKIELWSGDEKQILLSHRYGNNQEEWLLINHEKPEESINLTKKFGVNMTDVIFANNAGSKLYALVDQAVRLIDIDAETLSRPLVEKVHSFSLYADYVLFVSLPTDQKTQQIGYVRKDFKQPRVVEAVPFDGENHAQFSIGKYYDKYYFLITHGKQAVLTQSKELPEKSTTVLNRSKVKTYNLSKPITSARITDNGQFATIQDGWSFATYDLEVNRLATTEFQSDTASKPQELRYLDRYLLWAEKDGYLRTYEFDGANQHNILPMNPEFGATLSPTGKYLYAVQESGTKRHLVRVQLLDISNPR